MCPTADTTVESLGTFKDYLELQLGVGWGHSLRGTKFGSQSLMRQQEIVFSPFTSLEGSKSVKPLTES